MQRTYKVALFILLALPSALSGQNYVNNPYTRFAIGDLINSGLSYNRSLGGSSIALRPKNQINYLNPAAYSAQDTMSFLFQAGLSGRSSELSTASQSDKAGNANLDYLALGFPITRWWNFSAGLVPFNRVQYFFREGIPEEDELVIEYEGNGGYNQFYFGTSFELFDMLSLGFNANYLFGDIERKRSINIPLTTSPTTINEEDFIASDFYFGLGFQFYPSFTNAKNRKHSFILGGIYDFKSDINIKYTSLTSRHFSSLTDTFTINNDTTNNLTLPVKFGLGLSYNYNDQLMVSLEYQKQQFSNGIGWDTYAQLKDYASVRFGAEYIPVPLSHRTRGSYLERMHYRVGAHYTNSYLAMGGEQINDIGFSIGLGFPWRNSQKLYTNTAFNITYEYGIRGTTDNGLIQENYHVFTVGVTLFDYWFLKPKYD